MNIIFLLFLLFFLNTSLSNADIPVSTDKPASNDDIISICKYFDALGHKTNLKFVLDLQLNDERAQSLCRSLSQYLDDINSSTLSSNPDDVTNWLIQAHFNLVTRSPSGTLFGTMSDKAGICSERIVSKDQLKHFNGDFSTLKPGISLNNKAKDVLGYLQSITPFDYIYSDIDGAKSQLTDPDALVKTPPQTIFQLLETFVLTQKHSNLLALCLTQPDHRTHVTVFVQNTK